MTSTVSVAAPVREGRMLGVLVIAAVLYTFICTFPGDYQPLIPGLDGSWMFALNKLADSGSFIFGRDVVFTYGPFGFLLDPRAAGSAISLTEASLFWAVLQVSFFSLVVWRLRRNTTVLLLFCGGYLTLNVLGLWPEYRFLFITASFALSSLEQSPRSWLFSTAASMLALCGLQMKWSLGLGCSSVLGGSWLILILNKSSYARRTVFSGVATALIGLLGVIPLVFHSPLNFWSWVRSSLEITASYSSAMSLEGPVVPLVLAFFCVFCIAGLYFQLTAKPRQCLWILSVVSFLGFKEGFVRQDGHRLAFFCVVSMIPILLFLATAISQKDKLYLSGTFVFLSTITIFFSVKFRSFPALRAPEAGSFLLMRTGLEKIQKLAHLDHVIQQLNSESQLNLHASVLPDVWLKILDDPKTTVSILPFELSIAAANPIHWEPTRVLQLYVINRQYLDELAATGLLNRGAKYLIATYEGIDGRNPILDTPLTWQAVMKRYAVQAVDPSGQRVLLVRKPPDQERRHSLASGQASMKDWISVQESRHLIYASLDLRYTILGKLANLVYKIPAVYINISRRSGRTEQYRLMTGTAASGILLNYLPGNQYEMEELFKGQADDPVVRFNVVAPKSLPYFYDRYAWELLESSRVITAGSITGKPLVTPEITPEKGEGEKAEVEITTSAPNGVHDVKLIQLLINSELNGVKACYLNYEIADNRFELIADAGHDYTGFGRPGEQVTLSNSQCRIPLQQASSHSDGNTLKLHLTVEFGASFRGVRHFYVYAMDRRGLHTQWQARALWQVH